MSEAILSVRAECRSCGWLGMGSERIARNGATENLYCPKCSSGTRSWIVDQAKVQEDLSRHQSERSMASQRWLDDNREARLAQERLHDAKRRTEFARHKVALLDKDHPQYLEAQHAMIAAQREEAEAALTRDQAMTRVKAGGR